MENENNPREDLYQRFKESLRQPVTERFFDEDELVEIYDYAGDIDDDYVQLEVLLCGARLYPESQILAERKALLYLDTTDDTTSERTRAAETFLADNPEASSILFDIARLEVNQPENAIEALEFLLGQYDTFGDEEIIRFVNLAIDLDAYDWLIAHIDEIKKKVSYLPAFLYEIAREADDRGDAANLVKLADALIEAEPFSPTYWMMLLRGQIGNGQAEEARQTFDYAKALAGDGQQAVLALTDIVYHGAPELLPELVEPLERLMRENPHDYTFIDCLCAIYAMEGRVDKIGNTLRAFLDLHPDHPLALRQYLMFNTADAANRIDAFFAVAGSGGTAAFYDDDWLMTLYLRNAFRSLELLLTRMRKLDKKLEEIPFTILAGCYFHTEKYKELVDLCESGEEMRQSFGNPLRGMTTTYIYCLSLVKIGRHADALAFARENTPEFQKAMVDSPLAVRMAGANLLSLFAKLEAHPADDSLFWDYYDPLLVGKFQ